MPQMLVVPLVDAPFDPALVLPQPGRRSRISPMRYQLSVSPGDKRTRSKRGEYSIGNHGPAVLSNAARLEIRYEMIECYCRALVEDACDRQEHRKGIGILDEV